MPTVSLAIEGAVIPFRRLMSIVLLSGTASGLMLFVLQHFTVVPLIAAAEVYESAARKATPAMDHDEEGWQPAEGSERTLYTAATTVLSGIGFAALLFGTLSLASAHLDARRGLLWGLAAFVCIALAPALGLPPQPPGSAVADLSARQLWWVATVILTAAGFWLLLYHALPWLYRVGGAICVILPHWIGAPAASGPNTIPAELARQFAVLSVVTVGVFWALLGAIGGFLSSRNEPVRP